MTKRWIRTLAAAAVMAGLVQATTEAEAAPAIKLAPVVTTGLSAPLYLTHAGDGSGRLFVVEQGGRVRVITGKTLAAAPFLDLSGKVLFNGERGLLGLAFHPNFKANRRLFVNYTRQPDGATVVSEFTAAQDGRSVSASTERQLLVVPQPYPNHNGGMLAFKGTSRLFVGLGDGGSGGDPQNRAQNPQELLGKILRLDVDHGVPYGIPSDNPFATNGQGRGEIFALGFRNPWRFSFDRGTGRLYAGDVGQGAVEEIDVVGRGKNYGWRITEGNACYDPATGCDKAGLTAPIATYAHTAGRCSITGGYVYRGRSVPALVGSYLFADFCTGEIFTLVSNRPTRLLDTDLSIVSFGEDQAGEVYVIDIGGGVRKVLRKS